MKKIVIVFIVLIFSYSISIKTIHADVGPPWAFFGSVVVSNREGAVGVYDGVVIPYGEVLEAGYMDGKIIEVKYGNDYISVNCEDIKPLEEYYYPEKEVDFENNYFECVVLNDVPALYKGPGLCYDKIDWMTIPKGSTIKCDPSADNVFWFYVSYEGIEGWLYLYEITDEEGLSNTPLIARVCNDRTGLLYDGTKIYYNAFDDDGNYFELTNHIDEFCNVVLKYCFNLGRSNDYFVVGDDFSGWVNQLDFWYVNEEGHDLYITSDNLNIYSDIYLTKLKDTIRCDGEYKLIYYQKSFGIETYCCGGAYIEYDNGKRGFIESNGDDVIAIWEEDVSARYPIENRNGICYLYNRPIIDKDNIIAEIPEGYRINYQYHYNNGSDYTNWYHIDDGKYCGWIKGEEIYENVNELYEVKKKEEINKESTENKKVEEQVTKKEEDKKHQDSFNVIDIIVFCLIIVFTIGTIIIMINKRRIKQIIKKEKK